MAEWDYSWDYGGEQPYDDWSYYPGGSWTFDESGGYDQPIGPGLGWDASSYPAAGGGIIDPLTGNPIQSAGGGGGFLNSILGGLGSVGSFLGNNASWLGPLAAGAGSIAGGAMGANASNEAARLQAAALNRGIDLQTAQWLQQQANQAPWLQAGQQALPQLQQLAAQGPQGAFQGPPSISGAGYALPQIAPTWGPQGYQGPQAVNAGDYRYTPGQGPQAGDYRYTPGQTPDAAAYRYTPGAIPTLQGAELLANDPGYQFRQNEARKALEASALAKGMGMSGATLNALQARSQDLASQEYGNAWNRAAQQAQMREQWGQAASQMGFGQALSAAQLREQVNQIASQQGWSQAQAEAAFREQLAQQAGAQNWQQALQGQQTAWQQGLTGQQWEQQQRQAYDQSVYDRMMQQSGMQYGRDVAQNQTDYERQLAQYNSQQQNQATQWNRLAGLAGVGQTAANQLGETGYATQRNLSSLLAQLGAAQGTGAAGEGLAWSRALGGAANQLPSILAGLNR